MSPLAAVFNYYYIMKSYTRYSNIGKYKNLIEIKKKLNKKIYKNINTMHYTNWTRQ